MSKKLVIVESPTKAKTITKFLSSDYIVKSSFGHIRDLPKSTLGVDVEKDFKPTYVVPTKAKPKVAELKKIAENADEIILATDEDREGEAIAWHLVNALKIKDKKLSRIVFHEITKEAILHALESPRDLDINLVNAQQARRILDRLVGYKLSPLLWSKVQRGLSAGRVQSVAMRLIVERERLRKAFKIDEYWTIEAECEKDTAEFPAKLVSVEGKKLEKLSIPTEDDAKKIVDTLKGENFKVSAISKKNASKKPPIPFKTSTLQQEANNALGFSAKQTMTVAQKLYETGFITYMRTDSVNLADKFLNEAQSYIQEAYGNDYAKGVVKYSTKSKNAQEAHEAIRPTEAGKHPMSVKEELESGQWKLYNLIWSRTMASQMPNAQMERTSVDLSAKDYVFRANGSIIVFDGFMKVYKSATEKLLPELKEGDTVKNKKTEAKQHFTEPPARYSDATLVKALEEHGIGRPSTYAPTINTIITRGYIERDDNKKLFPLDIAMIVNDMLVEHFSDIVDLDFTATMENTLDEVAEGKVEWVPMMESFYGPFEKNLEHKDKTLEREDVMPVVELGIEPESGLMIFAKTGRYGPYLQVGEWSEKDRKAKKNKPKMTSIPKGVSMNDVKLEEALELLSFPKEVGHDKEGNIITVQLGPYGAYLKAGKQNASLPEEYNPITLTPAEAEKAFEEAIALKKERLKPIAELGEDPKSKQPILIKKGRFGPYITDGETNVSVKKDQDPEKITHAEAVEALEKKRNSPKRNWGKKKATKKKK